MAADGSIKIDTSIDRSKLEKDLVSIKQSLSDAGKTFEKLGGSSEAAYKKITEEFDRLEKNAKAFGDVTDGAAEKKKYLKKQIEALIKEGLTPESEEIKALTNVFRSLEGASRTSGQMQKKSFESVLASIDSYENAVGILNTKLKDGFIDEKQQRQELIALTKKQVEQLYSVGASMDNSASEGHDALKKMTDDLKRMESEAAKSAKTLGDVKKEIAEAGKISGTALKAAAAAAAAMTAALTAAAVGFSKTADRIDKMSQSLSVSRDTFQKLDYVFQKNGASIDSFGSGIKSLQGQIKKTTETTDKQSTALGRLGISVTDANGKLKSQDDILLETLYAFNGIEEGVAKSSLAQEIFGKSAQDLMPLLNQEQGSIENLVKRAGELGLVLGDDAVNSGVALTDAITDLKTSGRALLNDAIAPLIPIITESINNFISWAKENDNLKNAISGIINVFKIMIPVLASATAGLAAFFVVAKGKAIILNLAKAFKLLTAAIAANPIGAIAALITAVLIPAIICLYKNWDKVVVFLQTTCVKIGSNLQILASKISEAFTVAFNSAKIAALGLFNAIVKKVLGGVAKLLNVMGKLPFVGEMFDNAALAVRGFSSDIENNINAIQEESRQAINAAHEKQDAIEAEARNRISALESTSKAVQENADITEKSHKRSIEGTKEATEAEKKLTAAINDYEGAVKVLDRKLKDSFIDQKKYDEELLSLTQKQIETLYEMGYSLQNIGTIGGNALQKLIDKYNQLNNTALTYQDILRMGQEEYSIMARKAESGLITQNELLEFNIKLIQQQIDELYKLGASTAESNVHKEFLSRLLRVLDELQDKKKNLDIKEIIAENDKAISILNKKLHDGYISEKQYKEELINLTKQQIEELYAMGYTLDDVSTEGGAALKELTDTLDKLTKKKPGFVSLFTEAGISAAKACRGIGRSIKETFKDGFGPGIEKVWDGIKEKTNNAWKGISGGIKNLFKKIKSLTIHDVADWARKIARAIDDAIPKITAAIKTITKQTVAAIRNGIALIKKAASFFVGVGKTAIEFLVKGFKGIEAIITGIFSVISSLAKFDPIKLYESLEETIEGLEKFFNDYLLGLPTFFKMCMESISSFIDGMIDNLPRTAEIIGNVITEICDMIINEGPTIVEKGIEILSTLLQAIIKKAPDLLKAAVTIFKSLLKGINKELPRIIEKVSEILPEIIKIITDNFPALFETGVSIVKQLIDGIKTNAPELLNGLKTIISSVLNTIKTEGPEIIKSAVSIIADIIKLMLEEAPNILETALTLLQAFQDGILEKLPELNETIKTIIPKIIDTIVEKLPDILETGIQIINTLTEGIIENIEVIVKGIAQIICIIIEKIAEHLPEILDIGIRLFEQLVLAIIEVIPQIIKAIIEAIPQIISALIGSIPRLLEAIGTIIGAIIENILENIPGIVASIIEAIPQIVMALINAIPDILAAIAKMAGSIIKGFVNGLSGLGSNIWDGILPGFEKLIEKIKEFFGGGISGISGDILGAVGVIADGVLGIIDNIVGGISKVTDNLKSKVSSNKAGSNALAFFTGGLSKVFGWAGGTENAPKGLSVVGEEGPELVQLKGGERIYPADETSKLLSGKGIQSIINGLAGFSGINVPTPVLQPQPININNKMTGIIQIDGREIGRAAFENLDHFAKAAYGY